MQTKTLIFRILTVLFFMVKFQTGFSQFEKSQAAYIYNICNYVEWPDNSIGDEFIISVVGSDSVYEYLQKIVEGKKIQNKPVKVIVAKSAEEASYCQVVFFPTKSSDKLKTYSQSAKSALIIAHKKDALSQGAVISFFIEANKLKFNLKTDNLTNRNIKISSKIKELASNIY